MRLNKEAAEVRVLFPDEVRDFMNDKREGSYTLLDVRQPMEYERGHLPGARLLPLPQLADSISQLEPDKPTIVYCAVGGRSRMAAQLLMNQGFSEIFHMQGGIEAWEDRTATGPVGFHLRFLRGDEPPEEAIAVAFEMEEGLKRFHELMKSRSGDPALEQLLTRLIEAEVSHEKTLLALLEDIAGARERGQGTMDLGATKLGRTMEGGIDVDEFVSANEPFLKTVSGYLDLAMMIETQALDLYLRMAAQSRNELTRKVLLRVADEEKGHLALLGRYLDTQSPDVLSGPLS